MKLIKRKHSIVGSTDVIDLPDFKRPAFADRIRFPNDITELTTENVSDLLGKYTVLLCYAQHQVSQVNIKILEIEQKLNMFETKLFLEDPRIIHLEKWRRDVHIKSDSRIRHLSYSLSKQRQLREGISSFVVNYERCISALSRELTRKMSMTENYKEKTLPVKHFK